jgi:magnesium transporter
MDLLAKLNHHFASTHPRDAADALALLPGDRLALQLSVLDPKAAAAIARYIALPLLEDALSNMQSKQVGEIYAAFPVDLQVVVWQGARPELREHLFNALPERQRRLLQRLTRYPEGSAAFLMQPAAFTVNEGLTVGDVLKLAGRYPEQVRFYVYVVDGDQRLIGVVTFRELMKAKRQQRIDTLMERNVISLRANTPHSKVLNHTRWQNFHALPVVDDDGVFLGVIRYETWRRESLKQEKSAEYSAVPTLLALGELFWVGLSKAMFAGMAQPHQRKHEARINGNHT